MLHGVLPHVSRTINMHNVKLFTVSFNFEVNQSKNFVIFLVE
jgi:hypothetical protein